MEKRRSRTRRGAAAFTVGALAPVVAGLCLLGTGNMGGYLLLHQLVGHPMIGTVLTAAGCAAFAFLVVRSRPARDLTITAIVFIAACCGGCQGLLGVGSRPAQHLLAESSDGRLSVVAFAWTSIDSWIQFRLRSNAGWRSREVCLDTVADAVPQTVAARFIDPRHVELTWIDITEVNTWTVEVDPTSLRVTGSRTCQ